MKYCFGLFFIFSSFSLWAFNPFVPYIDASPLDSEPFYKQNPPFKYPFAQDEKLNASSLNLKKLSDKLGKENKLNKLRKFYQDIKYDKKHNLYAYDFAIGTQWEMLPYPIVKSTNDLIPEEWNSHFKNEASEEGIQGLDFIREMDALTDSKASAGNELKLLKTPSLPTIIGEIEKAQKHVFMSGFLFQCDAGTDPLLKVMERRIGEGLKIYLIIDKVFTRADKKCVKKLRSIGVELGLEGKLAKVFHEKMYVFDGESAIVDGQNLVAAEALSNGHNNLINDMGVFIQGPLVQDVAQRFLEHWIDTMKLSMPEEILELYKKKAEEAVLYQSDEAIKEGLKQKSGVCRLVSDNPGKKDKKILPMYYAYLKQAENYLFFNMIDLRFEKLLGNSIGNAFLDEVIAKANANPHFRVDMLSNQWKLPTDIVLPEGMTVDGNLFTFMITKPGLLISDRPHEQIGNGIKYIEKKLDSKNFYWWAAVMYEHSKTMMIDNSAAIIGSFNINNPSQINSYEQTVVCHDRDLVKEMKFSILKDILNSLPIPLKP